MYEQGEKPKKSKKQVTCSSVTYKANNSRKIEDGFFNHRADGLLQRSVDDKANSSQREMSKTKEDRVADLDLITESERLQALANEEDIPAWQQHEPGLGTVSILGLFPARAMLSGLYRGSASLFGSGAAKSGLKPGSMSNEAVRKWYHKNLDNVISQIDSSLPLKEQALHAFRLRNQIKLDARALMSDRNAAAALPAPKTLQDVVMKAYKQGYTGDDVWRYVLGSSGRSNKNVDAALGLSR